MSRGGTYFAFLDLPPELRDRIYTQLLVFDQPTTIHHCSHRHPITQTNRQLRRESLEIYYSRNCFYITNRGQPGPLKRLQTTLKLIGPVNLAHIRRIRLDYNLWYPELAQNGHRRAHVHPCRPQCAAGTPLRKQHRALCADYIVACSITLIPRAPWFEMTMDGTHGSIFLRDGAMRDARPELHRRMDELLRSTLFGPFPGQMRVKMHYDYLINMTLMWQFWAALELFAPFRPPWH